MPSIPQTPGAKLSAIRFRVTAAMVRHFGELSGDTSSLHLDAGFGYRSAYRENVAHGFLPLLFLARLDWHAVSPGSCILRQLSATFLQPVCAGEELELTPTACRTSVDGTELNFEIRRSGTGAVVTRGAASLAKTPAAGPESGGSGTTSPRLLSAPLPEQTGEFEQISPGAAAGFDFTVTPACLQSLAHILAVGSPAGAAGETQRPPDNFAVTLLAASLCSTMVGMCLPGRRATFLNFNLAFTRPPALGVTYQFKSVVDFKSPTTASISQAVHITGGADAAPVATGKIQTRVNPPPPLMPSLESLRQTELDLQLRNKVVLITGGSRGLGATTARLFALHGAKVVINYLHSRAEAEHIRAEIEQSGGAALCVQADVTDRAQVKEAVRQACGRFGTIDFLVNNAVRDARPIPFLELTWDALAADLDVILKGAFNCCQEVLPLMTARRSGKIVNLATVFVETPPPGQAKYVIAKSALVGLTRSLAIEFAAHNIQVNLVVPSMVETDLSQQVPAVLVEKMKKQTPMNRLAAPVDVARAVVMLCSSLAPFTTGQKIMVTGGNPPLL